jgi:glycerate dehydrogenase
MAKIVVTFSPSEAQRGIIESALGDALFLKDDRSLLTSADIIFSWNPVLELKSEEFTQLSAGFMQVLSAGADHLPINQMLPSMVIASNVGAFAEPMAEHTMAMFLALAKRLYLNHQRMREECTRERRRYGVS